MKSGETQSSARPALWLAAVGTSCIVGGEALCLLGPIRYEPIVHFSCHVIFYGGIVLLVIGAVLHWTRHTA